MQLQSANSFQCITLVCMLGVTMLVLIYDIPKSLKVWDEDHMHHAKVVNFH